MTHRAPRRTQTPALAPAAAPAAGSLLARGFALFFAARGIARLGDTMAPVALAAGLVLHGHGAGAIGTAMASMSACFAGFVVFGGVIADRLSARLLMICADLVRVASQSLMAALFFTGHVVLWQICAISAVNGTCAAMFQPGVAGIIPRIARDVQRANGAIRTIESVMSLLGPAAAGILIGLTSTGGVFAAHAATYLLSALGLALLRLPAARGADAARGGTFRTDLTEGWHEFRSRTWLWGVIAIWMVGMIGSWGPSTPLQATVVVTEHGAGTLGLVNAAMGAGMVLGGLLAMRLRPVRPLRAGSLALLGSGAGPAAVGLGLPVPLIVAGLAVLGMTTAFWGVMWATSIQTQVPADRLSRVHAYDVAGSVAMMPVGQALAGPFAGLLGERVVLVANGAVALLVAVALLSVRDIRGLRAVVC